jgi:2-oxoglutarate dehydrogenase E1 component
MTNNERYVPLNNLGGRQARFVICNASLSQAEYGALGFELGYSLFFFS